MARMPPTEPRLALRLASQLRLGGSPLTFVMAGTALSQSLLSDGDRLPAHAEALADAMRAALGLVSARADQTVGSLRVRCAAAGCALLVARPAAEPAVRAAIAAWTGPGLGPARWMSDREALATRALLALLVDDVDTAAAAVDLALEPGAEGVGWLVWDQVVARIQRQGPRREAQCLTNLRRAVEHADGVDPTLVVLGGLVLAAALGVGPERVASWLPTVDPAAVATPVPVPYRRTGSV